MRSIWWKFLAVSLAVTCLVGMSVWAEPADNQEIAEEIDSTEDTSTEDTSTENTSTEDTSTEDTSTEDTSTEDTSTEDTSTKDTSTEPTTKPTTPTTETEKAPATPTLTGVTSLKAGQLTVRWKKESGVFNYELQASTDSHFKKNVTKKTVSAQKAELAWKGFKKDTKYYVRLRACGKTRKSAWRVGSVVVARADGKVGDRAYYVYAKKKLTVYGSGKMKDLYSKFDIKKERKKAEKSRAYQSFATAAEEVVIEPGITYIGKGAFSHMKKLKKVTIRGKAQLGDAAFFSCPALVSVAFPNGGKGSLGFACFGKCKKLAAIAIPEGVTGIGKSAFASDTSLKSVTLPSTLKKIGETAFAECRKLKKVTLVCGQKNRLKKCGAYAFMEVHKKCKVTLQGGKDKKSKKAKKQAKAALKKAVNYAGIAFR